MKLRRLLAGLCLLPACSVFAFSSSAWAMARPACAHATVSPRAAAIPANLPGFGYTALKATAQDVHLFAGSGTKTEVPLAIGPVEGGLLKVAPSAPLTPGVAYELQFDSFCTYGPTPPPAPLTFTATAASPLPAKLGEIRSAPTFVAKDYGTTQYTITASYTLDDEMKPWASVYQLNVVFDGKSIETKPTLALAADGVEVVAKGWCDQATAATKKHSVQLRGKLPFAPDVETASFELEVDCPAPKIGTPPDNPAVAPEPGAGGGTGTGTGTGTGAGNANAGSGGCSVTSSSPAALPALAALLGLAALLRRRKASS